MRLFDQEAFEEVNAWNRARGHREWTAEELPSMGMMVPGVAAGFMYQTDSTVAFLENFISNPEAKASEVSEAIDELVDFFRSQAKNLDIQRLVIFSKKRSIGKRAQKLGFSHVGEWQGYRAEV
jgi:hypothetical protein